MWTCVKVPTVSVLPVTTPPQMQTMQLNTPFQCVRLGRQAC